MNPISLKKPCFAVALGTCSFGSLTAAEPAFADRPPMREAPTNEQLVLRLRQQAQEQAARPALTAPPSEDPSKLATTGNLLSQSTILCYGGSLTLVPKRAVLQYPEKYADRLKAVPGAKVLLFADFYATNQNWITSFEVSRAQAEGKEPLPEGAHEQMTKTGNLVVATFHGNPVGLAPDSPASPGATGNASESQLPQP
jgi:hypothetical protein